MTYMRAFCLILSFLLASMLPGVSSSRQDWNTFLSSSQYKSMERHHDQLYLLADKHLFSTSLNDLGNDEYSYSRLSGLSGTAIAQMVRSECVNALVLVYEDGDIDIIDSLLNIHNVPDFKFRAITGSRTILGAKEQDGLVYVCGEFGFFILDISRQIILQSFLFEGGAYCAFSFDGAMFYSCAKGLFRRTAGNKVGAQWEKISNEIPMNVLITDEEGYSQCWLLTADNKFYQMQPGSHSFQTIWGSSYNYLRYDPIHHQILTIFGNGPAHVSISDHQVSYVRQSYCRNAVDALALNDSIYLFLDPTKGLIQSVIDTTSTSLAFITRHESTFPEYYNSTYTGQMLLSEGKLYCPTIGHFRLTSAGAMTALAPVFSTLEIENGSWSNLDLSQFDALSKAFTSFDQDSKNQRRFAFGTLGKGIFIFNSDSLEAHYTPENSPICNVNGLTNYYRANGIHFDDNGYLWFANSMTDTVLCSISPQGQWTKYPIRNFSGDQAGYINKILESQRDPYHFRWLFDTGNTGCHIAMYYDNGTPEDLSDDDQAVFHSLTDQDGNVINPHYMNDIVEDLDGKIWLMTSSGPFVIDRPIDCFNHPGLVRRIKIPRNDGTNLADYLLPDVDCICCVVDAANRKWIGTNGNGLYCISADGLKQIENFTTDNSPLLANNILALAYDDESGTLYISCEGGILSYTTDAIRGEEDFSNVYCYPNPVRPDYTGDLVIRGLMDDSQVAITDATGHVVYRGQSAGGSLSWDLTSSSGRRVASGVYLIIATDADGKEGIVSRFLVLK